MPLSFQEMGLAVLPAHGTYFLLADASRFLRPGETDSEFCQRLTIEAGVTIIPVGLGPVSHAALMRPGFASQSLGNTLLTY